MIQVTGLPGSGKSRGIDLFQQTTGKHPLRLDIRELDGTDRNEQFRRILRSTRVIGIAESACGVLLDSSYVIRLTIPIEQLYRNLQVRDGSYDPDYLSLLSEQMIRADLTVTTTDDLRDALQRLF